MPRTREMIVREVLSELVAQLDAGELTVESFEMGQDIVCASDGSSQPGGRVTISLAYKEKYR